MKHVVSYSGGIGSALSAIRVAIRYGTADLILLFADTLIESSYTPTMDPWRSF